MNKSIRFIRLDMIVFQIMIMIYLFFYGMFLGEVTVILLFIVTACNLIFILYELEKIHIMIAKTKEDKESFALLDEEKRKSLDHIKEIKEIFQNGTKEEMLAYIDKTQKEYYDEEVFNCGIEILNIILQRYSHICKSEDIKFTIDIQENVKALLEAAEFSGEQLCTVLGNLLDNSIDVLKDKEKERELHLAIRGNGYQVILEVGNNGAVIPPKVMEKLFNYGFSTKREGRGTGLFIVYKLIEKLGATLNVRSDETVTAFKIIFDLD